MNLLNHFIVFRVGVKLALHVTSSPTLNSRYQHEHVFIVWQGFADSYGSALEAAGWRLKQDDEQLARWDESL